MHHPTVPRGPISAPRCPRRDLGIARAVALSLLAVAASCGPGGDEEAEPAPAHESLASVLETLASFDERLATLESRLVALEGASGPLERLERPRSALDDLQDVIRKLHDAADAAAERRAGELPPPELEGLELPAEPSGEDVAGYVDRIVESSERQNRWSSNDAHVHLLAAVGREHIDVLLGSLHDRHTAANFHLVHALGRLVTDEDRDRIVDALRWSHDLAALIVAKRWETAARSVLLAELDTHPRHLPLEWIEAVAHLEDPESYDGLMEYLIHGTNRRWTYDAVKHLEGFPLDAAVAEAWETARDGRAFGHDLRDLASVALGHGHFDALETAVTLLGRSDWWDRPGLRSAIARFTPAGGPDDAIARWFSLHRTHIEWSPEEGRWTIAPGPVRDAAPAGAAASSGRRGRSYVDPRDAAGRIGGTSPGRRGTDPAGIDADDEDRVFWPFGRRTGEVTRAPDPSVLDEIVLSEDPDADEARIFVRRILATSDDQMSWSAGDAHPDHLAKVGRAHLDVLLDECAARSKFGPATHYLVLAIAKLATGDDRERIIAALPSCPHLVRVVRERGWTSAARDVLVEALADDAGSPPIALPLDWIEAVCELCDPSTHAALLDHFRRSEMPERVHAAIRDLPDLDASEAIVDAWRESPLRPPRVRTQLAALALGEGRLDALEYAVDAFDRAGDRAPSALRAAIARFTPAPTGTSREVREWFEANRARLHWDAGAERWEIAAGPGGE